MQEANLRRDHTSLVQGWHDQDSNLEPSEYIPHSFVRVRISSMERYCVESGRPVHMIPGDRCDQHGAASAPCRTNVRRDTCEHKPNPNGGERCEWCGKSVGREKLPTRAFRDW